MQPFLLATAAAALFGAASPLCKALLTDSGPFILAGLLYVGAALAAASGSAGLSGVLKMSGANKLRLAGAVAAGGIAGPALLMIALKSAPAASISLWLNLELPATALLGFLVFKDALGRLGFLGAALALLASAMLSWTWEASLSCGLVALACLCWGLDNHLTALIDQLSPKQTTFIKGAVSGSFNIAAGAMLAETFPGAAHALEAVLIGALCYGLSMILYVHSAQRLGATRSQMLFSSAPLFGVALAVALLGESFGLKELAAALLYILAALLLLVERHAHVHTHEAAEHTHSHRHDDGHHQHSHPETPASTRHSHCHRHEPITHFGAHLPDMHHRHTHS